MEDIGISKAKDLPDTISADFPSAHMKNDNSHLFALGIAARLLIMKTRFRSLVAKFPLLIALLELLREPVTGREMRVSTRSSHVLQRDGFRPECVQAALALCQDTCPPPQEPPEGPDSKGDVTPSVKNPQVPANVSLTRERGRRGRHCQDLKEAGDTESGIREIFPFRCCPDWGVLVYCNQDTDGGGWTVFQRRMDIVPRQDFYRTWVEYEQGFGNLKEEFWLGLELIHVLTNNGLQELRVDLGDCEGETSYAQYGFFHVAGASTHYKMHCGRYSGDAGDAMTYHSGQQFSARDADHDKWKNNCAQSRLGAWWYNACQYANLNGKFYGGKMDEEHKGISWYQWKGYSYSLCFAEMKIRAVKEQ